MTLPLIDKQDSFEIVRDQIAAILKTEITSQIALATTAGKPNPDDWKLRIFSERANPWEQFLNGPTGGRGTTPATGPQRLKCKKR